MLLCSFCSLEVDEKTERSGVWKEIDENQILIAIILDWLLKRELFLCGRNRLLSLRLELGDAYLCCVTASKNKRAVNDISMEEICLSDISDGVSMGECNVDFIYAKVEVTVQNGNSGATNSSTVF